ncbi:MAG: hypothetical protein CL949_20500 [Erythrobacter sp.]|nr:hypothetical protein [Erythrobacter sp.]
MPFSKTNRDIRRAETRALIEALEEEDRLDRRAGLRTFFLALAQVSVAVIAVTAFIAMVLP